MKTLAATLAVTAALPAIVAVAAMVGVATPTGAVGNMQRAAGRAPHAPASAGAAAGRIDALFARWNRPDSPGCGLGVSQNGVTVYERGYGMASLESKAAITPATVFPVASISKSFTAMSILLLAQRGRLSLDDEVRKHVPEWSATGHRVTIRHLLTHTGGLRDAFLLIELAAAHDDSVSRTDRLLGLLARQRGLNSTPGTEYQYNNGGYTLLGNIVARVSGQSLRAFADANIFKPLGMTHTHVHDDPSMLVPNRAFGYTEGAGGLHVTPGPDGIVGNAGLFSTVRDLLAWERNFLEARVGDAALLAAMETPPVLTGGDTSPYALGLQIDHHRGLRTVGHGGGDRGISAYVVRYPDRGLAIAVLCNLDGIDATRLTRDVAEIYLPDIVATPSTNGAPTTPRAVSLSAGQLARNEGLYRDPSTEGLLRIFVRDGTLMGSSGAGVDGGWAMTPLSANRFAIPGTPIVLEFMQAETGRVRELRVTGERPTPMVLQPLDALTLSKAMLQPFAGDFASTELAVTYTLAVRDDALTLQIPGRADITLQPVFADGFAGSLVGVVKFTRDARGAADGFTVNTNGARNLRFDRVQR